MTNDAPVNVDEFEALAREKLPHMVYDYYAGGAGDEWTLRENRAAFDRWVFLPRTLVDVSAVDLSTTVLGQPMATPIMVAPTAFQKLAHPDGELAMGRGCLAAGVTLVVSTIATTSLEEVAATGVPRWFQLYVQKDRPLTEEVVRRAEAAGYTALVVTVDAPFLGRRERDERNQFTMPAEIRMANLRDLPVPTAEEGSSLQLQFQLIDPSLSWDDIAWLESLTSLPVLVKGIMTPEDATHALNAGCAGVVVSNHGGRQLDGAAATLDALPAVVDAVGDRGEVLVDGGVRRGQHVLKALALGARAVLVGRPVVWGLAADGEEGVRAVLQLLENELSLAMALAGMPTVDAVGRELVTRAGGR